MRFAIANFNLIAGFSIRGSSWDLPRSWSFGYAQLARPCLGMHRQQRFAIDNTVQFHFDKAADAPQFHHKSFQPKGDERREIKGKRRLPAAVEHAVILDVVQVEVVGERIKTAMHVVAALKKDSRGEKARNSSVGVAKGMDSDEKKVSDQSLDHRMQSQQAIAGDESDVFVHQSRQPVYWRAHMQAANFPPPHLDRHASQSTGNITFRGAVGHHPVHGHQVGQCQRWSSRPRSVH